MLPPGSHGDYADGTDIQTPDRYMTISARRGQRYRSRYGDSPRFTVVVVVTHFLKVG